MKYCKIIYIPIYVYRHGVNYTMEEDSSISTHGLVVAEGHQQHQISYMMMSW